MKGFFSFIAGAMLGAAVGTAAALLVTPYSGVEVREMTRDAMLSKREQMEARLRELRAARKRSSASEQEV